MATSWRPGCPVALDDLRFVTLTYVDLKGRARQGELVVHRRVVRDVRQVFRSLYEARFPIRTMRLVDDFGGDDDASMAADNTSAFNCRRTTAGTAWSAHAYGRAIDVNPRENPYVRGDVVLPPAGRAYLDRGRDAPGLIAADGPVVAAFSAVGWTWGGTFRGLVDYQHFSQDGR
jgi:poly-gamma-glutamate synthesis protein (capsule biosynthesis protein)